MKLVAAVAVLLLCTTPGLHGQAATDPGAIQILHAGSQPSRPAPSDHFTGLVRVQPLFPAIAPAHTSGALITFAPGARTDWHTHPLGQILIVTSGTGLVQRWGDPVEEIHAGDIVWIPPGQKHWHGAAPDSPMTHIAIVEQLDGKTVHWMEKVSDAQYATPPSPSNGAVPKGAALKGAAPMSQQPSAAQKLMGDIDPKLAELTDNVLFGDVWQRPELSPRDRSLITVAALIALNRPEQLRSHIRLALRNGVTRDEIVEVITQMAFYSGWPNAVSAVAIAREVFQEK